MGVREWSRERAEAAAVVLSRRRPDAVYLVAEALGLQGGGRRSKWLRRMHGPMWRVMTGTEYAMANVAPAVAAFQAGRALSGAVEFVPERVVVVGSR